MIHSAVLNIFYVADSLLPYIHKSYSKFTGWSHNVLTVVSILVLLGAVMSNTSPECEVGAVKLGSQAAGSSAGGQREGQSDALTAEELRKRRQAYFDR